MAKKVYFLFSSILLSACNMPNNGNFTLQNNHITPLPLFMVLQDLNSDFQLETASNFLIKQSVIGDTVESPNLIIITITQQISTDDAVSGIQHVYHLVNNKGNWVITNKKAYQKCHIGRGGQSFSSVLCR